LTLHATLNRRERELSYLQAVRRNQVDGLIFVTNHPDDGTLAAAINASGPVVAWTNVANIRLAVCDNEQEAIWRGATARQGTGGCCSSVVDAMLSGARRSTASGAMTKWVPMRASATKAVFDRVRAIGGETHGNWTSPPSCDVGRNHHRTLEVLNAGIRVPQVCPCRVRCQPTIFTGSDGGAPAIGTWGSGLSASGRRLDRPSSRQRRSCLSPDHRNSVAPVIRS
jgi:hypothetical protein